MILFKEIDFSKIREVLSNSTSTVLITFRNHHGPTKLEKLWLKVMDEFGVSKVINWWSSSGTTGLIESETDDGRMIFGQWALSDKTQFIGIFEVDDEDIVNIRDGFDAGNVTSPAMRAFRIGETGDRD